MSTAATVARLNSMIDGGSVETPQPQPQQEQASMPSPEPTKTQPASDDAIPSMDQPLQSVGILPDPVGVAIQWRCNFPVGMAVKYIGDHIRKGSSPKDLRHAVYFLSQEIAFLEGPKK